MSGKYGFASVVLVGRRHVIRNYALQLCRCSARDSCSMVHYLKIGKFLVNAMHPLYYRPALQVLVSRQAYQSALRRAVSSATNDELRAARAWLKTLDAETIPLKSIGEMSFSRSSGPGGQNVNKVNSKATLKVDLEVLLQHIPIALHGEIRRSRYVASRSNSIIVQADDSRKQSDNAQSCYQRLYEEIAQAGRDAVPNDPSPEQTRRVKNLQKQDAAGRLKLKKQHSAKKNARRGRIDY